MARTRENPRISLTKLAEYMVASASRRWSILRDQRDPSAFKAAKWTEAYSAIADVLLHGGDPRRAKQYLEEWRRRAPTSKFESDNLKLWIQAMTAFAAQLDSLELSAYRFIPGRKEAYVPLGGVAVSVRPDLLIEGDAPGAFKIYLGKSSPLTKNEGARIGSGTYAATVLHMWAEAELGAEHEQCLVLDVFARSLFTAPGRTLRRRQEVLANCREIAIMWASLESGGGPPSGHGRPRATGAA